jgi:hypothetical protein
MTLRKNAPRAKTRWMTLGLAVAACMLLVAGLALATGPVGTASGFEDDDANLIDNAGAGIDWNTFAPVTWAPHPATTPTRQADKVSSGWTFKGIEDWQATTTDSGFAGGTKQDADCPSVISAKAPNKDDLKRIYLSTKVVSGHTYLNLAWVRIPQNTTSPSAHIGFEFNKGNNGACGAGSDSLVKRSAGDMLIVYDFEGGGSPVLTLRRWITTGSCEVSSDSAPCWGVATNLTAGGFAEGAVNTGSAALDQLTPPALNSTTGTSENSTLGLSEFGEAGIDLTNAGIFTAGSCESFGTAYGVSRSSGNSGTAQMKDLVGPAHFTLSNCGTVIIHKVTSPAGDTTTNFGYTTNVTTTPSTTTSPFSLKDGQTNTIINVNAASSRNVTENDPGPGYSLTSIDCSASTVPAANYSTDTTTRAVTFSIAGGETLECTFTNTKATGALSILKNSTKGGAVATAGAVFSYDSSSVTDNGAGDEDSAIGSVCVSGLTTGDYTVNETSAPAGYGTAPASEANQTATVVAGTNCTDNLPGASATATFTNPPLSDIQVNFRDGGSSETSAVISCDNTTGTSDTIAASGWDTTETVTGVEAPTTIHCTITIDP